MSTARATVLVNPANPMTPSRLAVIGETGRALGVEVLVVRASDSNGLDRVLTAMVRAKPAGLIVFEDPVFSLLRARIIDFARKQRLAVVYTQSGWAEQGGLIEYAPKAAANTLGLEIQIFEVTQPEAIVETFGRISRARVGELLLRPDPAVLESNRAKIAELALSHRLPAIYPWRHYVDSGGLMSYNTRIPDFHRRAATYVDRLLKGAKPGDLPVEQPTKYELVINLKTAKALGLTIPQSLLQRADQVIE
jgi:ABC-type uncharacterized transport system substrate-binding protein